MPDCLLTTNVDNARVNGVDIRGIQYKTPGQLILALLESHGWSQRVLAVVLGIDETGLNKVIAGKRPVDADLALQLNQIFDVDAEEILSLQKEYELAMARLIARPDPKVVTRAAVFGKLPVSEMVKRGWLRGATDVRQVDEVEQALCRFFEVEKMEDIVVLPHSAKKTGALADLTPAQAAWLQRVRQLAADLPAAKYSPAALESAVSKLKPLLISPEGVRKVPRIMIEAGIRFVIVECLPSAKIDGVCFWLNAKFPVIGMSLRYDRIDNFWFVLRHEIEHVRCEHGRAGMMFDADLEHQRSAGTAEIREEERVANEAAQEFCVPKSKMENFIARKAPIFAERDIRGFAATLGVHPGIVAGQLQHHTGRYDLFRNHLAKIRSIIAPNAQCDGWGTVVPISS
jgi:HTH-type transcriptional regulator/antitoxin HigA